MSASRASRAAVAAVASPRENELDFLSSLLFCSPLFPSPLLLPPAPPRSELWDVRVWMTIGGLSYKTNILCESVPVLDHCTRSLISSALAHRGTHETAPHNDPTASTRTLHSYWRGSSNSACPLPPSAATFIHHIIFWGAPPPSSCIAVFRRVVPSSCKEQSSDGGGAKAIVSKRAVWW